MGRIYSMLNMNSTPFIAAVPWYYHVLFIAWLHVTHVKANSVVPAV